MAVCTRFLPLSMPTVPQDAAGESIVVKPILDQHPPLGTLGLNKRATGLVLDLAGRQLIA
jgi:hypothetical protein